MRKKEGIKGIQELGHREYVGGLWEELGLLQFEFMKSQGLLPNECFLDIACGSLRGGQYFINYLNAGNYLGIDKEEMLIKLGKEKELGNDVVLFKRPEFVISDCFEFSKFSKIPRVSLAHSLFTHLTVEDIDLCLSNLRSFVDVHHVSYVTFFEGDSANNPTFSHSHDVFHYSVDELISITSKYGWELHYIGEWNHPRDQKMIRFLAK